MGIFVCVIFSVTMKLPEPAFVGNFFNKNGTASSNLHFVVNLSTQRQQFKPVLLGDFVNLSGLPLALLPQLHDQLVLTMQHRVHLMNLLSCNSEVDSGFICTYTQI